MKKRHDIPIRITVGVALVLLSMSSPTTFGALNPGKVRVVAQRTAAEGVRVVVANPGSKPRSGVVKVQAVVNGETVTVVSPFTLLGRQTAVIPVAMSAAAQDITVGIIDAPDPI